METIPHVDLWLCFYALIVRFDHDYIKEHELFLFINRASSSQPNKSSTCMTGFAPLTVIAKN